MTWRGRAAAYISCVSLLWQVFRTLVLHRPLGWLGLASVMCAVIVLVMAERYTDDAESEEQP